MWHLWIRRRLFLTRADIDPKRPAGCSDPRVFSWRLRRSASTGPDLTRLPHSMEAVFFVFLLVIALAVFYLRERKRTADESDQGRWRLHAASASEDDRGEDQAAAMIRVLVAEDNMVSARILSAFLARMGCSAAFAADGKEALRVAGEQRFSLAIVDLSMPEMDGFDFARRYRRQEGGADHLPIIALTADAAEKVTDRCFSAGMDGVLTKPILYEQLVAVVQQYTRKPSVTS